MATITAERLEELIDKKLCKNLDDRHGNVKKFDNSFCGNVVEEFVHTSFNKDGDKKMDKPKRYTAEDLHKISSEVDGATAAAAISEIMCRLKLAAEGGKYSSSFDSPLRYLFTNNVIKYFEDGGFDVQIIDDQRDGWSATVSWIDGKGHK